MNRECAVRNLFVRLYRHLEPGTDRTGPPAIILPK